MMKRREIITLVGGAAAWPLAARAQPRDSAQALLLQILRLHAEAAAAKISQFLAVIESQVAWTTQLPWSALTLDRRRFDGLQLLAQAPAIIEFAQLDPSGREQLRVSRHSTDIPNVDPKCIRAAPLPAQAEVGGLGIGVGMQGGVIKVVTPFDKTPAAKAGILANDIISAIDDEPVQGLTLDQAVQKMRGPVNTKIKLTVARMGEDKPIEITITRESIRMLTTVSRDASTDPDVPPGCPDQLDASKDPIFSVAMVKGVYFGPVYFRRSEPYMILSRRGAQRNTGVSVVEINLKLVWDVVSGVRVGEHGVAYMVDAEGKLIAHPDRSLVLRDTDLSGLAQVRAARAGAAGEFAILTQDMHGLDVFAAYAPVAGVGWSVLVELSAGEADAVAR